jgi:hypothetical protein
MDARKLKMSNSQTAGNCRRQRRQAVIQDQTAEIPLIRNPGYLIAKISEIPLLQAERVAHNTPLIDLPIKNGLWQTHPCVPPKFLE